MNRQSGIGQFLHKLGPGLIFAAAAVGVSHLVQSTRAGAAFGLAMFGFIIFANAMKYPAFRFGPHYAAATNTSLLQGYRRQGTWALVLYLLLTLATMFTVQAAVTMVTAGLFKAWLGLSASPVTISMVLLAVIAGVLAIGRYRLLDLIVKALVGVLTVSTVVATVAALQFIDWGNANWFLGAGEWDATTIVFIAALIGWMPSAIDVAVWNSLWTLAKSKNDNEPAELESTMVDFHVGYIGTAILAVCFMLLGAGVMHGEGIEFAQGAGGFAAQVLELYAKTLGEWSRPIIGLAAAAVMFSTTLAVADGFPRALAVLLTRFVRDETSDDHDLQSPLARKGYWASMALLMIGAVAVIAAFVSSLKEMVDVATTLSFLTAPLLAWLNHRSVTGPEVAESDRPAPWLYWWSIAGIVAMSLFAIGYIYLLATR